MIELETEPVVWCSFIVRLTNRLSVKRSMVTPLVVLLAFSLPSIGRCCEPIVPLYQLLSGSSAAGPMLIIRSLPWLLAAIAIKCGAFAFLDRSRLSWRRAIFCMLVANVVSTIPGMLVGLFTAVFPFVILAIPLVFAMGWMVQHRVSLLALPGAQRWVNGWTSALAFIAFFFVSLVTFGLAGNALENHSYPTYWLLKFLFVAMAAGTGILISAVLEECVIARLASKSQGNTSFYTPVLRSNYATLVVILLVAALEILPKRLNAPHFVVSWLHSLSAVLGIG